MPWINYLIRGRNLDLSHPHRLKPLQLPYMADLKKQLHLPQQINIHWFSYLAKKQEEALERADKRARVKACLNVFHKAAQQKKTGCEHEQDNFNGNFKDGNIFFSQLSAYGPGNKSHVSLLQRNTVRKKSNMQRI